MRTHLEYRSMHTPGIRHTRVYSRIQTTWYINIWSHQRIHHPKNNGMQFVPGTTKGEKPSLAVTAPDHHWWLGGHLVSNMFILLSVPRIKSQEPTSLLGTKTIVLRIIIPQFFFIQLSIQCWTFQGGFSSVCCGEEVVPSYVRPQTAVYERLNASCVHAYMCVWTYYIIRRR